MSKSEENPFSYPRKKRDTEYLGVNCITLFMDVVGYSKNAGTKEMRRVISRINETIDDCLSKQYYWGEERKPNDIILILTGDGFAVGYNPNLPLDKPLEDAIDIYNKMTDEDLLKVRIGVAKGFNVRYIDKDDHLNLIGPGINLANRVMTGAAENQILIHEDLIEELKRTERFPKHIQPLPEPIVTKHGEQLIAFNYYKQDEFGSPISDSPPD